MERNSYIECGPSIEQYLVDMAQMMKPEEFIVEKGIDPIVTIGFLLFLSIKIGRTKII
jgi:hypothetical protein